MHLKNWSCMQTSIPGCSRGRSGEGGAELACFHLFPVLMEVCVDFDAAFLVFG